MKAYSVTQAADYLGIARQNVHKAIKRGKIKAHKIGNVYMIREKEVERYRETR